LIKFGVREATAFVGHSFADDDRQIVDRVTQFLSKLGVTCESGARAEPRQITDKVMSRLLAAELFVGIFTRREPKPNGGFGTSAWVIEEKAAAIQAGKRLLLFVEEGVEHSIGGLQGNYEYILFNRTDLADALIRAMDYVLAVTMVPLQCQVDYATNSINIKLAASQVSLENDIRQLLQQKQLHPNDPSVIMALATRLEQNNQRDGAISEVLTLIRSGPQAGEVYHQLGHFYENARQLDDALINYQSALDRKPNDYKFHRCYGLCLYQKAKTIADPTTRRSTLEKAQRLLQRAALLGGDKNQKQVDSDLFLVQEALAESGIPANTRSAPVGRVRAASSKTSTKKNAARKRKGGNSRR
jgi:tetratricopeptide (TPR) repeat protein